MEGGDELSRKRGGRRLKWRRRIGRLLSPCIGLCNLASEERMLLACMPLSTHLNAGNNRACWLVSSKQTCSNNALYSLTRSTTTENVQPTHVILLDTTKRNGSRLFFLSAIRRSRSPFHIRWANGFAGKRTLSSSPRHRAPPRPVDASSSPKLVLSASIEI